MIQTQSLRDFGIATHSKKAVHGGGDGRGSDAALQCVLAHNRSRGSAAAAGTQQGGAGGDHLFCLVSKGRDLRLLIPQDVRDVKGSTSCPENDDLGIGPLETAGYQPACLCSALPWGSV